jgi:hypothetical protein
MQHDPLERQEERQKGSQLTLFRKVSLWFSDHFGLVIFLSALGAYIASLNGTWATDHSTAIVEFQYAIYSQHLLILGKVGSFTPHSVDVFQYQGNYFMANAPGVAFFTYPFAAIAFAIYRHFTVFGYVLLLTEIPIALANSLATYLVFKLSRFYFTKEVSSFLAFAYAFSTISWPFATYLFQSDVSAMLDLLVVYLAIKASRREYFAKIDGSKSGNNVALSSLIGLALTCAVVTDYINGILIPILGAFLLVTFRRTDWKNNLKIFGTFLVGSVGITILLLGTYNYLSFGKILVSSEQLYLHSASLFGNFTTPLDMGLLLNLVTPMRGLFFFSPVLIFGVWGLWKMMRLSILDREALLFLCVFLGILFLYSAWYDADGGLSFGPRLIVSAIPFLLIPAGFVITNANGKQSYSLVYLLYAAGVITNGIAAFVGVLVPPSSNWMFSPFFAGVLPKLLQSKVDVWWISYLHGFWFAPVVAVIGFALFLPMIASYSFGRNSSQSLPENATLHGKFKKVLE